MTQDAKMNYPAELVHQTLTACVETEICLVNFAIKVPGGRDVTMRADITSVGRRADGALAIELIEEGWDEPLTVPIDWIDYWDAECPEDWDREFPTCGNAKGLRFVLDAELDALPSEISRQLG